MTSSPHRPPLRSAPYEPAWGPPNPLAVAAEGVLGKRLVAYCVDFVVVLLLSCLLGAGILVIGLLTLGLGWALLGLLPLTAFVYAAVTVGGRHQATVGMRMTGLRAVAVAGGRVGMVEAAVHALLFYVALTTFLLWCLDVGIGFLRADRRLGHDLLVGLMVVREG